MCTLIFESTCPQTRMNIRKTMLDRIGRVLDELNNTEFLKVTLDCNPTWNYHIATFIQTSSKHAPFLGKARNLYSFNSLKRKHKCLISSNLIYGNSIWESCKKIVLKPLVFFHKKILRAMGVVQFTYSTHGLYKFSKLILN